MARLRRRQARPSVLIATPVKDAAGHVDRYVRLLEGLDYPGDRLSLAMLESDSADDTYQALERELEGLRRRFRKVDLRQHDFGYRIPDGIPRWADDIQTARRSVLARSRNRLVSAALDDHDWVLWLDVDLYDSPPDVIDRLLATGKDVVQPNCVLRPGGPSFDLNAWRDRGSLHLHDLRGEGDLVPIHAVGATMLLVRADLHRDGLVFPPYHYGLGHPLAREGRGEIESEGLGIMAHDMGATCWGMPNLEITHVLG